MQLPAVSQLVNAVVTETTDAPTRAFLYAGTPTVVVSQWNVSDRATVLLMDRFYAELRRGSGNAEALRTATLATRRQFPDRSAWAAFEVVGEPR